MRENLQDIQQWILKNSNNDLSSYCRESELGRSSVEIETCVEVIKWVSKLIFELESTI